jgi:hypothetical protein
LAVYFSHDLFLEDFSRAYLRYAGWNWTVKSRPHEGENLYNLTAKTLAVLGLVHITLGGGGSASEAEIFIVARRDKPGFKCFSVGAIADRLMDYEKAEDAGIIIKNLHKEKTMRGSPHTIRRNFFKTFINIKIKNL